MNGNKTIAKQTIALSVIALTSWTAVASHAETLISREDSSLRQNVGKFILWETGQDTINYEIEHLIGSPRLVQRTPVFANAPFLRLKTGDKLFKGRRWHPQGKGTESGFDDKDSFFVRSQGKYYNIHYFGLWSETQGDKLLLRYPAVSVLFDWEVHMANATQLKNWYRDDLEQPLSVNAYYSIKADLRKDFANYVRDYPKFNVRQPRMEGVGTFKRALFEGLGYDSSYNTVFHYRLEIGKGIFRQYRRNLIVGPPQVSPSEFEPSRGGINSSVAPDPKTAAKKRAEYQRMRKFQQVIEKHLLRHKR